MVKLLLFALLLCTSALHAGDRRVRHLAFSLGSGTGGASAVWFTPALRGYADGDLISSMASVGAATIAASATGTRRPSYKTAIVGGQPVLRFNGSTNVMTHTLGLGSSPATLIACVKANSGAVNPGVLAACAPSSPLGANLNAYGYGYAQWSTYANAFVVSSSTIKDTWTTITQVARSYNGAGGIDLVTDGVIETFTGSGTYAGDGLNRRVIGGGDSVTTDGLLNGDLSLAVIYGSAISPALRGRIEKCCSGYTFRIPTY